MNTVERPIVNLSDKKPVVFEAGQAEEALQIRTTHFAAEQRDAKSFEDPRSVWKEDEQRVVFITFMEADKQKGLIREDHHTHYAGGDVPPVACRVESIVCSRAGLQRSERLTAAWEKFKGRTTETEEEVEQSQKQQPTTLLKSGLHEQGKT
ncbi:hypothetical protein ANCCAN_25265 [Ancylostoma caninum]|uniref:Uncharacterized protein n=1 Tax=Ancylostoma caninum TaxID=29170 RepID=A0A368FA48_ANCCA|nr:hypothetical protein ANCCAN_25265 [Ancylostoma caninum]